VKREKDPFGNPLFGPSSLKYGIKTVDENIKQFLMRKVKRHRPTKDFDKLPENIKALVKRYGDLCANFTKGLSNKYDEYKKFDNFSEETATEMSLK
jgi:hypothetical protein